MRVALFFIATAVVVYVYRVSLSKRERQQVHKGARRWAVPALLAWALTSALIFFALNFNGKVL